jgi:tetratricopeptide (TPR) repeat protein
MPGSLEYIDAYFNQTLNNQEAERFEQMLLSDKAFAEEVAFYLSAKQVLNEQNEKEKKDWFKELLANENSLSEPPSYERSKKIWLYRAVAAAAIIVLLVSSWYLFVLKSTSVQQQAETYIQKNLATLPVTMGANSDSIQQGLKLYNLGQFQSSQKWFELTLQNDTSNYSAKKYLGIVYLRLADYDKAFLYFQQLGNYSLYSNPAKFYQALALMKRNLPGDKAKARRLLQQVVDDDLEGKSPAQQFLKYW